MLIIIMFRVSYFLIQSLVALHRLFIYDCGFWLMPVYFL